MSDHQPLTAAQIAEIEALPVLTPCNPDTGKQIGDPIVRLTVAYRDALVRDLRAAREALEQCARQFEWYAASHAAKGAGEKAERNAKFAAIARAALPEETPNG